ncbi:hypothetical protein [Kozakia baliensis]|uniref:hypothetical protein n=1 Tax=Kozakia baliensis TaxID=153496 RepID=UPI001314FA68|nr:hypothetical protein [Kozakia baliensis]
MTRLWILSDLHLEAAGDIWCGEPEKAVARLRDWRQGDRPCSWPATMNLGA